MTIMVKSIDRKCSYLQFVLIRKKSVCYRRKSIYFITCMPSSSCVTQHLIFYVLIQLFKNNFYKLVINKNVTFHVQQFSKIKKNFFKIFSLWVYELTYYFSSLNFKLTTEHFIFVENKICCTKYIERIWRIFIQMRNKFWVWKMKIFSYVYEMH